MTKEEFDKWLEYALALFACIGITAAAAVLIVMLFP